ncbi:MAG: ferredoxin--NADP reductase [Bordetella sp.]|nr:MAG: ferredoxin--NADP reductase [Bordetella sp.]
MKNFNIEHVLTIHHWNENLFSFTTTRNESLNFINGHFVLIGILINDKPIMRAYSIVSANYEKHLEFLSIKIQQGLLTSTLQNIKIGDKIFISAKPVGTLILDNLKPGKNLYLFSTGTGLAPFMSIIKDSSVYERFDKIILVHGVRLVSDLAYASFIENELPSHKILGNFIRKKLIYYPTVTRQDFKNYGRITDLIMNKNFFEEIGLQELNPEIDRAMICGNPSMLTEISNFLKNRGFKISSADGKMGDYVVEKAFLRKKS